MNGKWSDTTLPMHNLKQRQLNRLVRKYVKICYQKYLFFVISLISISLLSEISFLQILLLLFFLILSPVLREMFAKNKGKIFWQHYNAFMFGWKF